MCNMDNIKHNPMNNNIIYLKAYKIQLNILIIVVIVHVIL